MYGFQFVSHKDNKLYLFDSSDLSISEVESRGSHIRTAAIDSLLESDGRLRRDDAGIWLDDMFLDLHQESDGIYIRGSRLFTGSFINYGILYAYEVYNCYIVRFFLSVSGGLNCIGTAVLSKNLGLIANTYSNESYGDIELLNRIELDFPY